MTGEAPPSAIRMRGFTLEAGGRVLLENADLDVREHELCLLVGASGTGKSLTLGLLAGLIGPGDGLAVKGEASVLGHDVIARDRTAGVPGTGVVFQDFALLDDVNAEANVRFGLDHSARPKSDRAAAAKALLDEFGLPGRVLPAKLSGGMKQRLALARVLAFDPRLVFYDEPTSGLDPKASNEFSRLLQRMSQSGVAVLMATHDLFRAKESGTRVGIMKHGRLVAVHGTNEFSHADLERVYLEHMHD